MTPDRVTAAIAWGKSLAHQKENDPFDAYVLRQRQPVSVTTPFLRVAMAARRAAEREKPFTASDVTADMLKPVLSVYAQGTLIGPLLPPDNESDDYTEAVDVEAVYIVQSGGTRLTPLAARTTWSEFKNEALGVLKHSNVTAEFPLEALAPGNEIRVDLRINRRVPLSASALGTLR